MERYTVDYTYDPKADVWIATSNDIPGLVLESGNLEKLKSRVELAIPELIELDSVANYRFN